jgi:hypothetical protein
LLKVMTTAPANKFMMKKLPKMTKTTKNKDQYKLYSLIGYKSIPTESIP